MVDVVHIVGGGSRNELVGPRRADAIGLAGVAGPVEATTLATVLIQTRTHDAVPASVPELRALVARSTPVPRYEPT
jgi:rhamnulokinase